MILHWLLLSLFGQYALTHADSHTFVCPADTGTYPHPHTNTQFYRCVEGKAVLHICTTGTFVDSKGMCLEAKDVAETNQKDDSESQVPSTPSNTLATKLSTNSRQLPPTSPATTVASSKASVASGQVPSATTSNSPRSSATETPPNSLLKMTPTNATITGKAEPGVSVAMETPTPTVTATGKVVGAGVDGDDTKPKGEAFRAVLDYDHEDSADHFTAKVEEDNFKCPEEAGFFKHPTNCSRFYWCIESKPTPMFCSEGTAFDPEHRVCSWAVGSDGCGEMLQAATHSDRPDWDLTQHNALKGEQPVAFSAAAAKYQCPGDGFYADPHNCSVFYHCTNGKPYRHQCQPGTAFNKDKRVCSWPVENDGCGGMLSVPYKALLDDDLLSADQDSHFQCPDLMEGYYPDPQNCKRFFHCADGKHFPHRCGNGTAFNREKGVCSWPLDLKTGCGASPPSSPPPPPSRKVSRFILGLDRNRDRLDSWKHFVSARVQSPQKSFRRSRAIIKSRARKSPSAMRKVRRSRTIKMPPSKPTRKPFLFTRNNPAHQITVTHHVTTETTTAKTDDQDQEQSTQRDQQEKPLSAVKPEAFSVFKSGELEDDEPLDTKSKVTIIKGQTTSSSTVKRSDYMAAISNKARQQPNDAKLETNSGKIGSRQKISAWPWKEVKRSEKPAPRLGQSATTTTPLTVSTTTSSPPTTFSFVAQVSSSMKASSSSLKSRTTTTVLSPDASSPVMKMVTAVTADTVTATTAATADQSADQTADQSAKATTEVKTESYRATDIDTNFRCPLPAGHFRDPMNCAVYYHCSGGVAYRVDCPFGKLYDVKQHQCLPISQVKDCRRVDDRQLRREKHWMSGYPEMDSYPAKHDLAESFECETQNGYHKNERDCTAYIECINGIPYHRKCMPGTVFDASRKKCTWSNLVPDCRMAAGNRPPEDTLETALFKCPRADGYFMDQASCSAYYHCIDGQALERMCDPNFFFDPLVSQCRWEKLVTHCDPNGHPIIHDKDNVSSTFVCPLPNGHFRDPEDCSVFYHCLQDIPHRGTCNSTNAFDVQTLTCMPRAMVPECRDNHVPEVKDKEPGKWQDGSRTVSEKNVSLNKDNSHDILFPWERNSSRPKEMDDASSKIDNTTFKCPTAHGLYRDPKDCRVFYQCLSGRHFRHECQLGTVFSVERKLCTWPFLVPDCGTGATSLPEDSSLSQTVNESETQTQPRNVTQVIQNDAPPPSIKSSSFLNDVITENDVTSTDVQENAEDTKSVEEVENVVVDLGEPLENHPQSYEFNNVVVDVSHPFSVGDTGQLSGFICPLNIFDQYFRDPLDCTRFHRCVRGIRFTFDCPRGTFFDPIYSICDFQENVLDCDHEGKRLGASGQPAAKFGNVPVPISTVGRGESMSEPSPSEELQSGFVGLPSSPMCPKAEGMFSHPSSCRKFVYCKRGLPTVLACPANLLFNVDTRTCDYSENVICVRYD